MKVGVGVIGKGLAWMRGAFGLSDDQVPRQLAVDRPVLPTVDAIQGGWANALWDALFKSQAAGTEFDQMAMYAADFTVTRIVTALYVQVAGGVAGEALSVTIYGPGDIGTAPSVQLFSQGLAGGSERFRWADFQAAGLGPILVPPGWTLRVGISTSPVTSTLLTIRGCVGIFPAGSKPV